MTGFLRLESIIGNKKKGIPAIIPVSRSTFLKGIKAGLYPKPFKLSKRTVGWKKEEIEAVMEGLKQ